MRTKKTAAATTTPQGDVNNATIMSAMQRLIPYCEENGRLPKIDKNATEALSYLQDRLSLTNTQVQLLAACCFFHVSHSNSLFDSGDLSKMLDLHPFETLSVDYDLHVLEDKGYIFYTGDFPSEGWRMEAKALNALKDNRAFNVDELRFETNMDFLEEAYTIIKDGMRHDNDNTIVNGINRTVKRNPDLPVVKSLDKLKKMGKSEYWSMVIFLSALGFGAEDFIDTHDLEQILSRIESKRLMRALSGGKHPFVTEGWVEPFGGDNMAQAERWIVTEKGWKELLKDDEDVAQIITNDEQDKSLIPYTSLHKKNLFFSGKTKEQVDRLSSILDEEHFGRIQEGLRAKGMPTGFCCLFYGTPGTGKTELVQQLAIATGRDLMQVNISTLRDKYVGESEKRLQAIFDSYRALVTKHKKAPILFFNEADAIFGNRMENTQRSVDKMENAIQNIILQEMEKLDGILICTTNLTSCLDKAFDRRFLFKLEFERPNNDVREHIWKSMLSGLTDEQAKDLAERYDFSGGQIQNITRKQIINGIFNGTNTIDYQQIQEDCKAESLSRNNGRKIGF